MTEQAVLFVSDGHCLTGVLHSPAAPGSLGVLVVVGGPQTRVGSHRQFVLLARSLADQGWPVLRFDYRGMGDSTGSNVDFEHSGSDIRAAIDGFMAASPGLERIVIWGLCDAASAACLYAPSDDRVAGLVMLNPWVRTPEGEARTLLRHYYLKRLTSRAFWKKLLSGGVAIGGAMSDLGGQVKSVTAASGPTDSRPLPERMRDGLERFGGRRLVILSGRDLVADEFRDCVSGDAVWGRLIASELTDQRQIDEANHTFARAEWRSQVADWTAEWLRRLP